MNGIDRMDVEAIKACILAQKGNRSLRQLCADSGLPASDNALLSKLLRGEPVSVESPRTVPDEAKTAERVEVQDEMKRLAGDAVEPIAEPEMRGRPERVEQLDPIAAEAQTALRTFPDMQVPTGEVDASGNAVRVPAADFIAKAEAEAARADTDANVYAVAAECLLGSL